jgi:hypothetical protein
MADICHKTFKSPLNLPLALAYAAAKDGFLVSNGRSFTKQANASASFNGRPTAAPAGLTKLECGLNTENEELTVFERRRSGHVSGQS